MKCIYVNWTVNLLNNVRFIAYLSPSNAYIKLCIFITISCVCYFIYLVFSFARTTRAANTSRYMEASKVFFAPPTLHGYMSCLCAAHLLARRLCQNMHRRNKGVKFLIAGKNWPYQDDNSLRRSLISLIPNTSEESLWRRGFAAPKLKWLIIQKQCWAYSRHILVDAANVTKQLNAVTHPALPPLHPPHIISSNHELKLFCELSQ